MYLINTRTSIHCVAHCCKKLFVFQEIPKFYPILKSSLNQPGLRDPPEAIFKINARPVLKFAYRLQEHLSRCASIVAVEQESLANSMKDVSLSALLWEIKIFST